MKKYLAIFRIRFVNALQYRTAALAGVATQFAWGFMVIFSFSAFYAANPAAFPMEFSALSSYIWMQQAFLMLFMLWGWDNNIFSAITTGSIAYEIVRPVDLYNRWFTQNVANRLAASMLRCAPVLIVAFLLPPPYNLILPPDIGQLFLFLFSVALSLGVVVSFAMLIYISVFYTMSPMGIRLISMILAEFLMGGVVPLPFFPDGIRRVVELLPFASMQNTPLLIYTGNIAGAGALRAIALQVFWIITLVIIGRLMMRHALKRVVVQGG
ncbi:MAG: hypothetical protein LBR41_00385 [Rickettsiales bacterium]|nr:hypothetical protein [Rickettsiales bacterium]